MRLNNFLKALTDLKIFISVVRLFNLFMQEEKKVFLKDFILDKEGFIIETVSVLRNNLFERGNINMNRDLVISLFCKKILIYYSSVF